MCVTEYIENGKLIRETCKGYYDNIDCGGCGNMQWKWEYIKKRVDEGKADSDEKYFYGCLKEKFENRQN